jgi:DNA-binding MarR family transcriptional regulator
VTTERQFWRLAWQMWMQAKQMLTGALAPLDLQPREFWLMTVMQEEPRPQRELAAMCGLDPSTLVPILDGMERRGWIERRRHPHDRRAHLVALTPAGGALLRRARPIAVRVQAEQMRPLRENERTRLVTLLRKLLNG